MDASLAIDWAREAVRVALVMGGPALLAALVVSVLIGIGQALTQMHDPVVGLAPRLAAVLIVLLVVLPWMIGTWIGYARELIGTLPEQLFG